MTGCSSDAGTDTNNDTVRLPPDNKSPNATNSDPSDDDMGTEDMTDPGEDCPDEPVCELGDARCSGADVEECLRDADGCPAWEVTGCPEGESCGNGTCQDAADCVDGDNDGYGANCPAGDDCDDTDGSVNPAATEMCDDLDNNCDQQIDEGYGIGAPCTSGMGTCAANGFIQCAGDGSTTQCGATAAAGDPEVCDGQDNDCNGMIDDGGVCAFCSDDPNEPNNTLADATTFAAGDRNWFAVCPGDVDYFEPTVTAGETYRFAVKHPEIIGDVKIEAYVNGALTNTADEFNDNLGFIFTAVAGEDYAFSIVEKDGIENAYHLQFSNENDIACQADDAFAPNYDINTAALFFSDWWTESTICFGESDWFLIDGITQGERIIIDVDALSFTNFNLYLWGDPDGDNTFTLIDQADGFTDSEYISILAPYTGFYFYEVRAPNDAGYYETRWQH